MRSYFSQFGTVNHVRLSRSKKTGNSKHYAFLEFASAEVAKIVANTMDNYLMFGHILKCKLVPKEQVHQSLWKGADRRFKKVPWNQIEGRKLELPAGRDVWEKRIETEKKRREKKAEQTKAIGYEFEGMGLKTVQDLSARQIKAVESSDETVEQEKTLVVDAGDGTMVVSEEIKTKKIKKGKKGKADNTEADGLVETVKALVGKGAEIVKGSLGEVGGLIEDAGISSKHSIATTAEKSVEATPEITKGAKKSAKKAKGKTAPVTEKTIAVANDSIKQAYEFDIASKVAEKSAKSKDLAATEVENAMRAVRDTVSSATDTARQLGDKDFSGQAADALQQAKKVSEPVTEKTRGAADSVSETTTNLVDSAKKAIKKGKSETAPLIKNLQDTAQTAVENAKRASDHVVDTASGAGESVPALAHDSVVAAKSTLKKGKAKAAPVVESSKEGVQEITEKAGSATKKGVKGATTDKNVEELGIAKMASELANTAVETANEVAFGVAEKASEVTSEIVQTATDATNAVPGLAEDALKAAKGAAESVTESVVKGAQGLALQAKSVATTTTEQAGKVVKGAKKGASKATNSAAGLADSVKNAAKDAAKKAEPTTTAVGETADSIVKQGKKAAKNAKDTTAKLSKDTVDTISSATREVAEKADSIATAVAEQASSGLESTKTTASTALDVLPAVGKTIATTTGDAVAIAQDVGTDVAKKVSGKGRKRKSEAADISEETVDVAEQGMTEMTGMTEEVTTEVTEELTIQETEDTEKVTKKTKRFSKKEIKPTITEEIGEGSSERKLKRSRKST